MAARVTEQEVKDIMDTGLSVSELSPFLYTANALVNELLIGCYSENWLAEIEKYLAAHFADSKSGGDSRVKSEKIGDSSQSFFDRTDYGKHALFLDYLGKLREAMLAKRQFELKVIG